MPPSLVFVVVFGYSQADDYDYDNDDDRTQDISRASFGCLRAPKGWQMSQFLWRQRRWLGPRVFRNELMEFAHLAMKYRPHRS